MIDIEDVICTVCGNLKEDCECDHKDDSEPFDFGDDERAWGYDGDAL